MDNASKIVNERNRNPRIVVRFIVLFLLMVIRNRPPGITCEDAIKMEGTMRYKEQMIRIQVKIIF